MSNEDLNISIFGLGYVGAVTAACLAERGFRVIGVDVNPAKVEMINSGQTPIVEEKIGDIVERVVADQRLTATNDIAEAIAQSSASLICVGTPSRTNGDLELTYVKRVAEQIGAALAAKDEYHTIILRSTVLPGTTEEVVLPILEKCSGKKVGEGFGLCFGKGVWLVRQPSHGRYRSIAAVIRTSTSTSSWTVHRVSPSEHTISASCCADLCNETSQRETPQQQPVLLD